MGDGCQIVKRPSQDAPKASNCMSAAKESKKAGEPGFKQSYFWNQETNRPNIVYTCLVCQQEFFKLPKIQRHLNVHKTKPVDSLCFNDARSSSDGVRPLIKTAMIKLKTPSGKFKTKK